MTGAKGNSGFFHRDPQFTLGNIEVKEENFKEQNLNMCESKDHVIVSLRSCEF